MRAHNIVAALLCGCTMTVAFAAAAQTPAAPVPKPTAATPPTAPADPWAGRNDLFVPPNLVPTTKVNVGQLLRSTTPNGMLLITVPRHALPSVDVTLAVRVPDTAEPIDKTGLAQFVAAMLRKGTQKRTADQISDAIDFVGGTLGAQASAGALNVSCHARARDLSLCLELLSDVAMNATFPDAEMGEARDNLMTTVNGVKDNPQSLASWHA
ncbi:MAG TPA: insulinase family protein, partial [Polyangia bacterium]